MSGGLLEKQAQVCLSKQVPPESRPREAKSSHPDLKMSARDLQLLSMCKCLPLQTDRDYTRFLEAIQGGNHCSLRKTLRPDWSLPQRTKTKTRTFLNVLWTDESYLNYLDIGTKDVFGVNKIQHSRKRRSHQL